MSQILSHNKDYPPFKPPKSSRVWQGNLEEVKTVWNEVRTENLLNLFKEKDKRSKIN